MIEWLDLFGLHRGRHPRLAVERAGDRDRARGLYLFARLGSRIAHRVFARITGLDAARRLLGEKLLSIAIWMIAILVGIDVLGST